MRVLIACEFSGVVREDGMSLDIKKVLALHLKHLRGEPDGVRANLYGANLSRANLYRADLSGANLYGANLYGADLSRANLYGADLYGADLSRANLYGADLSGANLSRANLYGANLSRANLYGANLSGATGLEDKYLKKQQIVPETGPFTGFKKLQDNVVAQLEITGSRVGGVCGRKCRTSEATVVGFFNADETPDIERTEGKSLHDGTFIYRVGETVKPTTDFNPSMVEECASGIHFYLSFLEAAEFYL